MRAGRALLVLGLSLLPGWAAMAGAAPAASISSDFDSANKLYERGKFAEAASAYEKIVRSGPVSAPLYFNLGNSLFKSGRAGDAIAAYRHAAELAPRDPDLRANLQFVRDQVQGPTLFPNLWRRRLERLTANEWTLLASLGLWVWLLLLTLTQLRPGLKPTLRTWTWLSGAATAALCVCLGVVLAAKWSRTVIVTVHDAAVRNGPLAESPTLFTVHDGAELSVLDQSEHWLQVSAGDRRSGWLEKDRVVLATPLVAPQQLK
jgi:tetratricopeptide (TPR) repeat protein